MKRLGLFTGKIYTQEDFSSDKIHECCVCLTDSEAEVIGNIHDNPGPWLKLVGDRYE